MLSPKTITHRQDSILNFIILSSSITSIILECYSNLELDTINDYKIFSITVALNKKLQTISKESKFQLKKLDDKVFCLIL